MVGRDAELSALLEVFAAADAGEAQVVVVTGEAGIGKTRLVRELVDRLSDQTIVAVGHAVPLATGALPYGLVADLLRSLVAEVGVATVQESLGRRAIALAGLVPRLVEGAPAVVDRLALFGATQDLLDDVSRGRTLVMVVEDAHWIDGSSLEVLVFWARTLVRGRLVLLVTSRDAGASEGVLGQLGELRRLPNATSVSVPALDAASVAMQVASLDPGVSTPELEQIVTLSDGVPLYVEELVAGGGSPGRRQLPDLIELDLNARLEALEPLSVEVLRQAALETRPFELPALLAVTGRQPAELDLALKEAVAQGILDGLSGNRWRFHHELLRQAAADSLAPSEKVSVHRRWAELLGKDPAARAADLIAAADHWEAVGPSREAFQARLRAARAARRLASTREAGAQWLRALWLLHREPGLADAADYEDALAAAWLAASQDWNDRLSILEAEQRATRAGSRVHSIWMTLGRFCLSRLMEHVHAVPLTSDQIRDMRTELEDVPPSALAAAAATLLIEACSVLDLTDEKNRALDLLQAMSATLPDEETKAAASLMETRLWDMADQGANGLEEMSQLVERALAASGGLDSMARAWMQMRLAFVRSMQAQPQEGLSYCLASLDLIRGPEADVTWYVVASGAAMALEAQGRWDEALALARRCREPHSFRDVHNVGVAIEFLINHRRGLASGLGALRELLVDTLPGTHHGATGYATRFLPQIFDAFTHTDDPALARTNLREFLEAEDVGEHHYAFDAMVLATQLTWMSPPADDGYLELTRSAAKRATGDSPFEVRCERVTEAHLARATGSDTSATWRSAVRAMDDLEWTFHRAQCRIHLAEVLLTQGHSDDAAASLGDALTIAEQLEARPLTEDIRSLASRARLPLPGNEPVAQSGDGGLTAREHEVLQLLVTGQTNEQIGKTLYISPRTASVHVSRILAKLGANNRTEVTAIAHRRGLTN